MIAKAILSIVATAIHQCEKCSNRRLEVRKTQADPPLRVKVEQARSGKSNGAVARGSDKTLNLVFDLCCIRDPFIFTKIYM